MNLVECKFEVQINIIRNRLYISERGDGLDWHTRDGGIRYL